MKKDGVLVFDGQQEYPRSIPRRPAASDGGIQWRLAEMKRGFVLIGQMIVKRTDVELACVPRIENWETVRLRLVIGLCLTVIGVLASVSMIKSLL